jgi:hypothetical protein
VASSDQKWAALNGEYDSTRQNGMVMQKPRKTPARRETEHLFTINITAAKVLGWSMLCFGLVVLTASMAYASSALAFIGLGLVFWGAIITYIQTEDYVKMSLLDATALPSFETLGRIIKELNYKGNAVHLPSNYIKGSETKVYIPKQKNMVVPTAEEIQNGEDHLFIKKPKGILIMPPGRGVVRLLEKTLKKSFVKTDMKHLRGELLKVLTKDLEIVQAFEFEAENNTVRIGVRSSAYRSLLKDITNLSSFPNSLGCPLSSAIACVLAEASEKPVAIKNWHTSDDGNELQVEYLILKE